MLVAHMKSTSITSSRKRRQKLTVYLVDDELNSFEHVIVVLTSILPRCNEIKAESIAMITHNTGYCEIARLPAAAAIVLFTALTKAGLTVKIGKK